MISRTSSDFILTKFGHGGARLRTPRSESSSCILFVQELHTTRENVLFRNYTLHERTLCSGTTHYTRECFVQELHTTRENALFRNYTLHERTLCSGTTHYASKCFVQELHTTRENALLRNYTLPERTLCSGTRHYVCFTALY